MNFPVTGKKISRYPAAPLFTACVADVACALPTSSPSEAIYRGHELRGLILEQEIRNGW
jgi:hypothetical protein